MEALAMLGLGLGFAAGIWMVVVAFQQSVVWGLVVLFFPLAGLVFVVLHWQVAKRPFFLNLAALGLMLIPALGASRASGTADAEVRALVEREQAHHRAAGAYLPLAPVPDEVPYDEEIGVLYRAELTTLGFRPGELDAEGYLWLDRQYEVVVHGPDDAEVIARWESDDGPEELRYRMSPSGGHFVTAAERWE